MLSSPAPPAQANAPSPYISPTVTPTIVPSPQFTETPPLADDGPIPRSRELSVDRPIARSTSPVGRIAEQMPLPASPSEATHPVNRNTSGAELNGSPKQKRPQQQGTPIIGTLPLAESNSSPSFGHSPSRSANAGLGVGPVPLSGSGLGVPTTKAERRRSINPAMTFNMDPINSTFSAEPRNSPLPPSPLRASFTDMQQQRDSAPKSPVSPSPHQGSTDGFPFKVSDTNGAPKPEGPRPPRTSSLPDHLSGRDSPGPEMAPSLPPKLPSGLSDGDQQLQTPKLQTPTIRPMSFSLSDPDFAIILNQINQDGAKNGEDPLTQIAKSSATVRQDGPIEGTSNDAAPGSPKPALPHSVSSTTLARSPHMDQLSSAVDSDSTQRLSDSRSPSRTRLSPSSAGGPGSTPQMLRTRQASAESTTSVGSRLAETAFSSLVEVVAQAKHTNQETVPVDVHLLNGVIAEMEDLKDLVSSLRHKYMGVKVSTMSCRGDLLTVQRTSQQYSEGLTVAGEEYDKELALRRDLEAEVIRLRAQVHTQTARLSVISGDERRQETMRRRSHDLANSLTGLERDISKLRAQRDMELAEVEELKNSKK